jgi:hypothetical protein
MGKIEYCIDGHIRVEIELIQLNLKKITTYHHQK